MNNNNNNSVPKRNKLVNRRKLGDAIRNDLYDNLVEIHNETGIPRSKLLDKALELLSEKYNKPYAK